MKTASRKQKGRTLQNYVRDLILNNFPDLFLDDVKCALMGEAGTDIKLSTLGKKIFPFSVECKNNETLSIWSAWKQAEANKGELTPLLVMKRNHAPHLAVVDLHYFMSLVGTKELQHEALASGGRVMEQYKGA